MIFVTSVYGKKYGKFLLPHLYSIHANYPESKVIVFWNDIRDRDVYLLKRAFKNVDFVKLDLTVSGGLDKQISSKVNFIAKAVGLCGEEIICFMDCDAIVHKRFDEFLRDDFDVIFTWKNEKFPLNTGVLIVKNNDSAKLFIKEWVERTNKIIKYENLLKSACDKNGAADQQALRDILAVDDFDSLFIQKIKGCNVLFKGVNCAYLNETRSTPITNKTRIIHYKSGWHPILLEGKGFSQNRPKESSKMMFDFWNKNMVLAKQYFESIVGKESSEQKMKLLGVALILFSFVTNPFFVGKLLSQNGTVDSAGVLFLIVIFELFCLILGGFMLFQPKSLIKKMRELLLLLLTSILFIIFVEGFLQIQYPSSDVSELYCYNAVYGWDYCKNVQTTVYGKGGDYVHIVKTNSAGRRGSELLNKSKKTMVVLGDSFASNLGINNVSEVFTNILESKYLDNYNVVNLGVDGFGTVQEYLKLNDDGLGYSPERVLLLFYIGNDFYDNLGINDWQGGYKRPVFIMKNDSPVLVNNQQPHTHKKNSIVYKLINNIRIITFFNTKLDNVLTNMPWLKDSEIDYSRVPTEIKLADLNDSNITTAYFITCEVIKKIKFELDKKGIQFYVIIAPTALQVRNEYFDKLIKSFNISGEKRFLPNKILARCLSDNAVSFIDLSDSLVKIENTHSSPYLYYPNEKHWTREGNAVVADLIYTKLFGRQLLKRNKNA